MACVSFATGPSLPHHASLAGREWAAGYLGDPWIVQGPAHHIGWGEGRVPPSLQPPPRSMGQQVGRFLTAPSGFFCIRIQLGGFTLANCLICGRVAGGLARQGLHPETASAMPGISLLCTGPPPPACCLEGPCRFLFSTAASSPALASWCLHAA